MDINVVLKCARIVFRNKMEENPSGGLKMKIDGEKTTITYKELVEELTRLENTPVLVPTCETCQCADFTGCGKEEKAQCNPKNFTTWRHPKDYCSFHVRREGEKK